MTAGPAGLSDLPDGFEVRAADLDATPDHPGATPDHPDVAGSPAPQSLPVLLGCTRCRARWDWAYRAVLTDLRDPRRRHEARAAADRAVPGAAGRLVDTAAEAAAYTTWHETRHHPHPPATDRAPDRAPGPPGEDPR